MDIELFTSHTQFAALYVATSHRIGSENWKTKKPNCILYEEEVISSLEILSSVNPIPIRRADYAHHITASPSRFENLSTFLNSNHSILHRYLCYVLSSINKLTTIYKNRWCKPHLVNENSIAAVAMTACKYLRWLSRRVPPRVQIANTRFHFNAFHTLRRYQNRQVGSCMFCKVGEDSIEHFVLLSCDPKPFSGISQNR